ncbi:MAG: aspartate-semialdehyde dehydrogenase [Pelagibacterales bacterium]|nr:aspartate-semialdehyde dehydrogenase [Pelagibacterales bacterium]
MKLVIVGATGMVGSEILKVIQEKSLAYSELILVASKKSKGKELIVNNKSHFIIGLDEMLEKKPEIALFSAGSQISKIWAPRLAEIGCKVIDNSSYWRMVSGHKLIIPEINGSQLEKKDIIIANPNCSTIQLLIAIAPLHKKYKIKRIVISTYQSVTGTGKQAVDQLNNEERGLAGEMAYPHPIYRNALPHIDDFESNGYTKEEMKMVNETHKILDQSIAVTATAVRIPIEGGHCESVNITFSDSFGIKDIYEILNTTEGLKVVDDVSQNSYPMPINTKGKDDVFVGRIRKDYTQKNSLNLWIVADNLRKGAATNTVQIAEYMIKHDLL